MFTKAEKATTPFQVFVWKTLMNYFAVETNDTLMSSPKIGKIPGLGGFLVELNKAEDDWDRYLHDELIAMTSKFGKSSMQNPEQKKFITLVMDPIDEYVSENSFNSVNCSY